MSNVDTLEKKRRVFEAFSHALVRESHNLMQRPDLLWQQLYNRLQWEEEPVPAVLRPEYERRTTPGATPWLRTRTPFRESEALIRILAGHTSIVNACAVSPDGSFIVSASIDNTLKVWDAQTYKERATLKGHTDVVCGCAVSPEGSFIVSASADKTLKVWDAATGAQLATIPLLGGAQCVTLHPQHPLAAAGDSGGNVYILDLAGMIYGPIIVTTVDFGDGLVIRCPGCLRLIPFQKDWLGQEITCPQEGCRTRMKVNPFVVGGKKRFNEDKGTRPKPSGSGQLASKTKKTEKAQSPEKKEQVTESRRAPKGKKWWQLWR